jgi:hypothetical protein
MLSAQPLIDLTGAGCNASGHPFLLAQTDVGGDFNLSYCQFDCRLRFGHEPTGAGGFGWDNNTDESYQLQQYQAGYVACLDDCQRKFWQQFDKKTREGGKTH